MVTIFLHLIINFINENKQKKHVQVNCDIYVFFPGIKIVGGKSTVGGSDYGIFVKKILAGGKAEAEGRLENVWFECLQIPQKFK